MKTLALAFILAASGAQAGDSSPAAAPLLRAKVRKIRALGSVQWEPELFRARGSAWCEDGQFVDAVLLKEKKELRVVCAAYGGDSFFGRQAKAQFLDADAKAKGSDEFGPAYDRAGYLERGAKAPIPVTWRAGRLRIGANAEPELPEATSFEDVEPVGASDGGPLVALAHGYGDNGVTVLGPDGKKLWTSADALHVRGVSLVRLGGKPRLAAEHDSGRVAFFDLKGKIVERAVVGGNADRLLVDDGPEPRLIAFDSGAGSKRETLLAFRKDPKSGAWNKSLEKDLGLIDVTAATLGKFGPDERSIVIGTSNGWVLLLDGAGETTAALKLRSKIHRLAASDLDGDGRDELAVAVEGASENLHVYSAAGPAAAAR